MQKIQVPFGFKSFNIGSVTVYTGKIRVKEHSEFIWIQLQNWTKYLTIYQKDSMTIIQFSVTDYNIHSQLIGAINSVLQDLMIHRIKMKYDPSYRIERLSIEELPF